MNAALIALVVVCLVGYLLTLRGPKDERKPHPDVHAEDHRVAARPSDH